MSAAIVPSSRHCLPCASSALLFALCLGGCALTPGKAATADQTPPSGESAQVPPDKPAVAKPSRSEAAPAPEPSADSNPTEGLDPSGQGQYHILAGELAAGRGQPQLAAQEFLQALDTAPDKELAARATTLALQANDAELALNAARRWLALDSTSLEAREVIVRLALHTGLDEEAYEQCNRIILDHPGGRDDGFHHVALLLSGDAGRADAALALMQRLVAAYPKLAGAYRAQSLLAARYNHPAVAEDAARAALKLAPGSKESALLLVAALVKKGALDEADEQMEGVLRNNPDANDLRLKYAQLLLESNQAARGREQLLKVLKADSNNSDARYLLGLLALDEHKPDEAQTQFELLAKSSDRADDAQYYLGRVAEAKHDPAAAITHYEKVRSGPQALDAAIRHATLLAKLGHLDDGKAQFERLRQELPQMDERLLLAEGAMLLENGAADQALALYNEELAEHPDDSDLLYVRSLAFEKLGQIDLAEADLRKVIAKLPDDARALNALGYMLTVHSERLDEAEGLIDQALKLTPDEPAVIDSAGWVRYRRGHADDALPLLQKAYAMFPDPEVAAHLGEVMWALGQKDAARSLLSRAALDDPQNAVLRDAVKRIER